jgi:branched-chain amino acid transport system substrate-binding protein
VLARWLGLAALAAAGAGLAGCAGGSPSSDVAEATGGQLAIYSSLPLQGPSAAISRQIVGGEKLALADAQGRAGRFKIGYVSLDDANPQSGEWSPDITSTNAKTAAQDTSTIAYIGDFNSAATAISLPLTNAAGILQVSPSSPYQGLTRSLDAGQDEPERFYLNGRRTFARMQPGDMVQAAAQARLMGSLGVRRLYVIDDQDPFEIPLADLVASDALSAGIALAAHDSISTSVGAAYAGEIEKILAGKPQAVFFAGGGGAGTVALWRALHKADPRLLLLGSSALAREAFTSKIGAAAAAETYLTTPVLPVALYPPSAQRVLRDYARTFGGEAEAGQYVLYGYEAMTVVLNTIRAAGVHGDDREAVIDGLFSVRGRNSVLGRYSIQANGETTLSRYGVERVRHGRPVFDRAIEVPPGRAPTGG